MNYASYGPPPRYASYEYRTSSASSPHHGFYSPRYTVHTTTAAAGSPTPKHARRATYEYSRSSPHVPSYYDVRYSSPSSARKADYVSDSDRIRSKGRRYEMPAASYGSRGTPSRGRTASGTHIYYGSDNAFGNSSDEELLPRYEDYRHRKTPPPPYTPDQRHRDAEAEADDYVYCHQVPLYTTRESTAYRSSKPRRGSYTPKQAQYTTSPPPKTRPATAKPPPPQATAEDARREKIPAGYALKNWDPREEPILFLGSVFDANSLGKYIYDWTVACYGGPAPMTEVAGDLWLLLIKLAGKCKRAEEGQARVRRRDDKEMLLDFIDSGDRLWERLSKILVSCETYMYKYAKRDADGKPIIDQKSGYVFVDTIFGRDRQLENTEKLMAAIRTWGMRYDANCEAILRSARA